MELINLDMIFAWKNSDQIVAKMQHYGVIPRDGEMKCPVDHCSRYFKIVPQTVVSDGVHWSCSGTIRQPKAKSVKCNKRASIRYKTFFDKSNLPLWKIAAFCHLWVEKCPLKFNMKQLSIASHTAGDWASFCREVVFDAFVTKATKIGGPGMMFFKSGIWKSFHGSGEDRSAETLLDCIEKFIENGTTIYSDCWKGYSGLNDDPHYQNLQVNHSLHFKDPETGVHTNSIESLWRHAKASGPYANRQKGFLGGYLARYMFLKKVKELDQDPLVIFFMLTRDLYDPTLEADFQIETEGNGDDDESENDFEFN